jgi:hypothetical protein
MTMDGFGSKSKLLSNYCEVYMNMSVKIVHFVKPINLPLNGKIRQIDIDPRER